MNEEKLTIEELQMKIDNGMAMKKLMDTPEFEMLFTKGFVENWALTQVYNVSTYQPVTRGPVMEQMLARSIFAVYCEDTIEAGKIATVELRDTLERNAHIQESDDME